MALQDEVVEHIRAAVEALLLTSNISHTYTQQELPYALVKMTGG